MPDDIHFLSTNDVTFLKDTVKRLRERKIIDVDNQPDIIDSTHIDSNATSAIYVARVPIGGLPALVATTELSTYTGTGIDPIGDLEVFQQDGVECQIYQLSNVNGNLISVPGVSQTVYNLSTTAIAYNSWVLIKQDRYGTWWVDALLVEAEVGTGTGTDSDETGTGDPFGDWCTAYRLDCVGGFLVQYKCDNNNVWTYDTSTGIPCDTELSTTPPSGYPPYQSPTVFRYVSNVCPGLGSVRRLTSTATISYDDCILQIDTSSISVTLPAPGGAGGHEAGKDIFIIKNATSGTSAINALSGNVEGVSSYNLGAFKSICVYHDNTNWWIYAGY